MELKKTIFLYSIVFFSCTTFSSQECIAKWSFHFVCENLRTDDFKGLSAPHYDSYVEIRNTDLKEIKSHIFGSSAPFKELKITSLNITKIYNDAFENLNLQYLNLTNNTITYIDNNSFNGLHDLVTLDLSCNKIVDIDNGTFSPLSNLKQLNLSHNDISIIKKDMFNGLDLILDLSNNKIFKIEIGGFDNSRNLSELYLTNNPIKNISIDIFNNLYNLKLLYLVNNQISKLQIGCFKHLNSLKTLNLAFNNISTLDLGIFVGLHNLENLNLSHNHLTTFTPGIFHNIDRISTLDISFNNFKSIDIKNTLAHIVSIKIEIYLEGNQWLCSILTQIITQNKNLFIKEGNDHNVTNIKGNYCTNEENSLVEKHSKTNKSEEEFNSTIELEENLLQNQRKSTNDNRLESQNFGKQTDSELKETKLAIMEANRKLTITNSLSIFMSILLIIVIIIITIIVTIIRGNLPFKPVKNEQSIKRNEQEMAFMSQHY